MHLVVSYSYIAMEQAGKLHLMFIILYVLFIPKVFTQTRQDWINWAQDELKDSLKIQPNVKVAKNVILFLGDGLGISTVTAARIYRSQLEKKIREGAATLAFEKFPHVALSKTYNANRQTTDSAGAATAYLCGVKANSGTVGVDSNVTRRDCSTQKTSTYVDSILKWSQNEGKSTGIITTARLSHASPAAAYAHSVARAWEGDVNTKDITGGCKDISLQLFEDNPDINVLLGGGRRTLLPNNETDPQTKVIDSKQRLDGRNLIKEWEEDKTARGKSHKYVWNKGQFDTVNPQTTYYLLGVFSTSHMSYELDRDNSSTGQPSIAEMTRKAIQILKKDDDGFFLFVEGARIDHAHHETKAKKALHDTLAFDDAVKAAVEETSDEDTLIIVTADHSHVFNIAGYPAIGNDILGLVDPMDPEDVPIDKMPYTTLVYGNGPNHPRKNLTGVDTKDKEYQQPAAVPAVEETHSAQDVAIFARGPMSHLFHGVHDQTYIAHVMAYASCVGMNKEHCSKTYYLPCTQASDVATINMFLFYLSITFIYLIR